MKEKFRLAIANQLEISESDIKDDSNIVDDLGADSLDIVELLASVEALTGIYIPDEDVLSLGTLNDVVSYIEAHS